MFLKFLLIKIIVCYIYILRFLVGEKVGVVKDYLFLILLYVYCMFCFLVCFIIELFLYYRIICYGMFVCVFIGVF